MKPVRSVQLPNEVSGRLYLHSMPGRYEALDEAWSEIQRLSVSYIVCLAPLDEIREKSPQYAVAIESGTLPCATRRLPICDYQGPDDDAAFLGLATEAADALRSGNGVLVHCGAGIGRTGTFAIAVLAALGLPMKDARQRVRDAGSAPERPAQVAALDRFSRALGAVRRSTI